MMHASESASPKSSCLTTCPYCGVGCGVRVDLSRDTDEVIRIVELAGDEQHPANAGRLCVKGSALADTTDLHDRLLYPYIADRRVSWDTALDAVSDAMHDTIREHGPDAVAFYVSGQLLTEDYYVANKLMKGFVGSANIDTNSRLCMSTAVAAHKRVLGSDSVPGCYEDLELADLIVITGSNMAWTHPIIYQRIMTAKALRPDMRLVVIDPRKTMTAESADLHLAITPGTDGFLFDGLLAWLINRGAVNKDFIDRCTEQFEETAQASVARSSDITQVASQCGLDEKTVLQFYQWFAETDRTVTAFCMGINQSTSGVDKASAILHCHLATGRIGKPGASPFSLTGQPNGLARGGRAG
jgi:assimilatory nitrate reductase catalytic subunit